MNIHNTVMALLERCDGGERLKDEMAVRGTVRTQSGDRISFIGTVRYLEPDIVLFVEGKEKRS